MPIPVPKDPELLQRIIDVQSAAVSQRDASINSYAAASRLFEEGIGRDFGWIGKDSNLGLSPQYVVDKGHELGEG